MSAPIKILGISGSLRRQSFNTVLLRTMQSMIGSDIELEVATLHGIPLYDGDLEEQEGLPQAVRDLKARILANDGLLLASPEYNNSIPGVFKNAIDWLSRPPADISAVFNNRPVAVLGASPSAFGTILAQSAWLPVLRTLGTRQWAGGRLMMSKAHQLVDANGEIHDEADRKSVV